MTIRIRPPQDADLEALAAIDADYAVLHGVEPVITPGALRFFERSGHSFVAEGTREGAVAGFLLAQAVWSGERPTVHGTRLAVSRSGSAASRSALVKALVKSAYDAGVYDLFFRTPAGDEALRSVLTAEGYLPDDQLTVQLVLGSRGQGWAASRGA